MADSAFCADREPSMTTKNQLFEEFVLVFPDKKNSLLLTEGDGIFRFRGVLKLSSSSQPPSTSFDSLPLHLAPCLQQTTVMY